MQLFVGTSGFSYKEWKGPFYPHDLPQKDMLRYYGGNLPAVEINNSFYRMPDPGVLQSWSGQVPGAFRFALKAPRRITHFRPLQDKGAETEYLFTRAAALGERLGPVLFQLPPHLPMDAKLLQAFLELLPSGARAAFEFRHPSWFDERVYDLLHAKGCALCCADTEKAELRSFAATTDWSYLRLRRPGYTEAELHEWFGAVRAQPWSELYLFFKHEEAGAGPRLARRFLEIAAQPA